MTEGLYLDRWLTYEEEHETMYNEVLQGQETVSRAEVGCGINNRVKILEDGLACKVNL